MRRLLVVLALCWTVTNLVAGAVALARLLEPGHSLEKLLGSTDRDAVVMSLAAPVLLLALANVATMGVTSASLRSRVWGAMLLSGTAIAFIVVVLVTPTTRAWLAFQDEMRSMSWLTVVNVLYAAAVGYLAFVVFLAERKLLRMLYGKEAVLVGYTLETTTEISGEQADGGPVQQADEAAEPDPQRIGRRIVDGTWTDQTREP